MKHGSGYSGVVALTAGGPHAWIMINALREAYGEFPVLMEDGEDAGAFWARRRRRLGGLTVLSMRAAQILMKLTKPLSRGRVPDLIKTYGLHPEPNPDQSIIQIRDVNSERCRDLLRSIGPKAVFVVSTRMIRKDTLACVDAPFINYHSGINPAYRGMYGGYFALANGEPEHFGATVHLVDTGVDTGGILYQTTAEPTRKDNFHTYLWLLAAKSRDMVVRAIDDALGDRLQAYSVDLPSRQWFAPTLGGYLKAGVTRGVW
ncbi:MAG: formyl transferase [Pseudomonadota bacterium]